MMENKVKNLRIKVSSVGSITSKNKGLIHTFVEQSCTTNADHPPQPPQWPRLNEFSVTHLSTYWRNRFPLLWGLFCESTSLNMRWGNKYTTRFLAAVWFCSRLKWEINFCKRFSLERGSASRRRLKKKRRWNRINKSNWAQAAENLTECGVGWRQLHIKPLFGFSNCAEFWMVLNFCPSRVCIFH